MKINKRVFYVLSSLLILGYSLISPFNSASALDKKDKYPRFNTTKKLLLDDGVNGQMDFTYYSDTLFFSKREEMYGRKIEWRCDLFNREQAFASYKKAIANNSGWLITRGESASIVHVTSSHDSLYYNSNFSYYWSEQKPDEQTLYYYGRENYDNNEKHRHNTYYWWFNESVRPSTYKLTAFVDYRYPKSIFIGCEKPNSYQIRLSADNVDHSDELIDNGQFDKISTFINTYPYKLDKNTITWDLPFLPDSMQQELYPHFEYDVKHLKLKVHHLKKEDHIEFPGAWASKDNKKGYYIPDKSNYYLNFIVRHKNGGDIIKDGVQFVPSDGSYEFTLPSVGEYSISAEYMVRVCYASSYDKDGTITPSDGDNCFYSRPDETRSVKYKPRVAFIKADGSSFSGSTLDMKCEDGFCGAPVNKPKYEDCSQFDWKFGSIKIPSPGSIACAIRNSFVWFFTDFLFGIIFPKIEDLQSLWDDLLNTIIDRLGFLALPFTFIKGVFTTVQAMTTNNSTCAVSLTVFGSTANLEMCRWRYQLPAVWSFMQIFLQGGIAIGFLWTCYRLANRFFGIYVEDYEEEDHDTQSIRWFDERTGDHGDWEERRKD